MQVDAWSEGLSAGNNAANPAWVHRPRTRRDATPLRARLDKIGGSGATYADPHR